ncbi:MAG: endolytic transglycosylase MltG [Prevotella sp.]
MKKLKPKVYVYGAGTLFVLIASLLYYFFFTPFSGKKETIYVYIDADDTRDSVITKLSDIATPHALTGFSTLSRHWDYDGDKVRTGRYAVEPGINTFSLFRHFKNGMQSPVKLTIPESRTIERLAGSLANKLMLDSLQIAEKLTDSAFCSKYDYDTATIMALFIPDTYEVYWNISLNKLMDKMVNGHQQFWNDERKTKASAMGLTPVQVATLASIVDEETANNGEKPMIAGMYYNRLKTDMPLQADPTIKYAHKDFALRRIYNKLLTIDSPYNTYKNTGLPPGPIKIASVVGIDAVLNYVHHNYLYMCAKEDFSGTHNFAETYAQHLSNASKYVKALNERGIK